MIVGVAIRNKYLMIMLPKPNRHCTCFWHLADIGIDAGKAKVGFKGGDQGFYTHTGKYLNRQQALKYVKRIKQPTIDGPIKHSLFSEDLW